MEKTLSPLQERLLALGISVSDLPRPGGSYVSVNVRGAIAYVAIQFPIRGKEYHFRGRLGQELSTAEGYEAATLAAMNAVAQVENYVGFDKVLGLNHVDVYYQSAEEWDDGPLVANGASDLFLKVLEEKGQHTRSIFGVHKLPRNFSVGISCTFTLL
ncbi:RidA family protein [Telluribacter sp.]|jgi:enamine deaminase RidA (YjgF/YER057c/UK114 family)|uniref:RidA family protein n=1 Tax=Telluribacter sp. TaxID=1978767 RepID=UPI002E13D437|nr:RidA family protein [Telluribacter sp.]